MAFVRAARIDEIPAGSIREFQVDGLTVAIANIGNKFYAVNNTCLHRPSGPGPTSRCCRHLPLARLAIRCHHRQAGHESGHRRQDLRNRGKGRGPLD